MLDNPEMASKKEEKQKNWKVNFFFGLGAHHSLFSRDLRKNFLIVPHPINEGNRGWNVRFARHRIKFSLKDRCSKFIPFDKTIF